jgi:hypothetical protein
MNCDSVAPLSHQVRPNHDLAISLSDYSAASDSFFTSASDFTSDFASALASDFASDFCENFEKMSLLLFRGVYLLFEFFAIGLLGLPISITPYSISHAEASPQFRIQDYHIELQFTMNCLPTRNVGRLELPAGMNCLQARHRQSRKLRHVGIQVRRFPRNFLPRIGIAGLMSK